MKVVFTNNQYGIPVYVCLKDCVTDVTADIKEAIVHDDQRDDIPARTRFFNNALNRKFEAIPASE